MEEYKRIYEILELWYRDQGPSNNNAIVTAFLEQFGNHKPLAPLAPNNPHIAELFEKDRFTFFKSQVDNLGNDDIRKQRLTSLTEREWLCSTPDLPEAWENVADAPLPCKTPTRDRSGDNLLDYSDIFEIKDGVEIKDGEMTIYQQKTQQFIEDAESVISYATNSLESLAKEIVDLQVATKTKEETIVMVDKTIKEKDEGNTAEANVYVREQNDRALAITAFDEILSEFNTESFKAASDEKSFIDPYRAPENRRLHAAQMMAFDMIGAKLDRIGDGFNNKEEYYSNEITEVDARLKEIKEKKEGIEKQIKENEASLANLPEPPKSEQGWILLVDEIGGVSRTMRDNALDSIEFVHEMERQWQRITDDDMLNKAVTLAEQVDLSFSLLDLGTIFKTNDELSETFIIDFSKFYEVLKEFYEVFAGLEEEDAVKLKDELEVQEILTEAAGFEKLYRQSDLMEETGFENAEKAKEDQHKLLYDNRQLLRRVCNPPTKSPFGSRRAPPTLP